MIDEILDNLIIKWNNEEKCGKCWKLVRTFNEHIRGVRNLYQPKDNCCTHIFLDYLEIKPKEEINETIGSAKTIYCDYIMNWKIAEVSDFGKPKAEEHGCGDNIYNNHIKSLQDCVSCELENDLCLIANGQTIIMLNKSSKPFFSMDDNNLAGLNYNLTVRVYKG